MAAHSSIFAWKIPCTEEPGGLHYKGSQRVGYDWVTKHTFTHSWLFQISSYCSILLITNVKITLSAVMCIPPHFSPSYLVFPGRFIFLMWLFPSAAQTHFDHTSQVRANFYQHDIVYPLFSFIPLYIPLYISPSINAHYYIFNVRLPNFLSIYTSGHVTNVCI